MWSADIDVDASLASRLISAQFPDLRAENVELFGVGWDNAAFRVDGRVIFRFPMRRIFAGLVEREISSDLSCDYRARLWHSRK